MKYSPETKEELQKLCNDVSINLADIDTSKIKDMSSLFEEAHDRSDYSGIETWDVSNVKDMSYMFQRCNVENVDFTKWNTSNVENMCCMFAETELSNIDLSHFDTSKVKDFLACFQDSHLENDPKIGSWNVKSGECLADMFLNSNFKYDLSKWQIHPNADTYQMTYGSEISDEQLPAVYLNRIKYENLNEEDNLSEFEGQIIDGFEDFLDEKGIKIINPDSEDDENAANIYGEDYGLLQQTIEEAMTTYDVVKASEQIVKEFSNLLYNYDLGEAVSVADLHHLENKTAETMTSWGFKIPTTIKTVKQSNHR